MKRHQSKPGRSCKRQWDSFSLVFTHNMAYATHGNLPSLKPIAFTVLNLIYNYRRCQISPLWAFVLLWVQVSPTLQGEEEQSPSHQFWVHHRSAGSKWKHRYMTSKSFQFHHTKSTKAQERTALNHCCVILFKAEVLPLTLLSCSSSISVKCAGCITGFALGQRQ